MKMKKSKFGKGVGHCAEDICKREISSKNVGGGHFDGNKGKRMNTKDLGKFVNG